MMDPFRPSSGKHSGTGAINSQRETTRHICEKHTQYPHKHIHCNNIMEFNGTTKVLKHVDIIITRSIIRFGYDARHIDGSGQIAF